MISCLAVNRLPPCGGAVSRQAEQNVRYIVQLVREGKENQIVQLAGDVICVTAKGKPVDDLLSGCK